MLNYALCVVLVATHYSCSALLPNECTSVFTTGSVHRKVHRLLDKDLQQLGRSSLITQTVIRALHYLMLSVVGRGRVRQNQGMQLVAQQLLLCRQPLPFQSGASK